MTLNIKKSPKVLVVFIAVFLLLSAAPSFAQPEGADAVHANLEDISLVDLIKFVGRYTGKNIVFNKGKFPDTKVSIYAGDSLTEPELMAVFQEVLTESGFHAVSRDNVTYIMQRRDALKIAPQIKASPQKGSGDDIITSVFQLDSGLSPAKAEELLKPFASLIGQVKAVPVADCVLVRDLQANILKMRKLLKIISHTGVAQQTKIIGLKNANSKEVASKLDSYYKKLSTLGKIGSPPVIEAVDWANSLLVSGSKDQLKTVANLVSKLDLSSESYSKLKVYHLHNTEAEVAGEVLSSLLTGQSSSSSSLSSSKKGAKSNAKSPVRSSSGSNDSGIQVSADKTTNSLLVMADQDQMKQIDDFVKKIDQTQDQVYIEGLVLETSLTNAKEFGVEWMSGAGSSSGLSTFGFTSSDSPLKSYLAPVIDGKGPNIGAMSSGFSMGVLGNLISYGGKTYPSIAALVNFTKSTTDFNLISAPQIMTLDNSEAEIFVGENRPYKTGESSTSGDSVVSSYEYKDVGVKLKITPHINREEGLIKLDVFQTYNTVSSSSGTLELPVTSDRKTKTTVLMADGSTMVIGGMIQSQKTRSQNAVPYLSDIPLLGWLFRQQNKSANKQTLMVFISARIIKTTEQLEAISKAKLNKYRNQRSRFNAFVDSEFNNFKGKSKDDPTEQTPVTGN